MAFSAELPRNCGIAALWPKQFARLSGCPFATITVPEISPSIMRLRTRFLSLAFFAIIAGPFAFSEVAIKELPGKARVTIDGQLFTEFHYGDAPHVYYYPVLGPGGVSLTRSWPMENPPDEEHDHPHHRSMWFSHGSVNGVDFWTEQ